MQFVAIVERRLLQWYVYLPALGVDGPVPEPNDVQATAVDLAVGATGLPATDLRVSLHLAVPAGRLLPTPPVPVEVCHSDGVWRSAQQTGWLRQRDDSWRAVVSYVVDGAAWERAMHASRVRLSRPAVPEPRSEAQPLPLGV